MTELKFSILEKLYNTDNHRINEVDFLNDFQNQRCNVYLELNKFIGRGYIRKPNSVEIELTEKGEDLYEDTLEAMQEREYMRKQNKTNCTIAMISVIAASIAALVPVIEFILSLFARS